MQLKSLTVKEYMSKNIATLSPDTDIFEAIKMLVTNRISGAPVVDKRGNIVGILSDRDCLRVALNVSYYGERGRAVGDYMERDVRVVDPDTSIIEVADMFLKYPVRRYPVVADNRLVGQISRHDVLRALEVLW